jgi:hypothetical protein
MNYLTIHSATHNIRHNYLTKQHETMFINLAREIMLYPKKDQSLCSLLRAANSLVTAQN